MKDVEIDKLWSAKTSPTLSYMKLEEEYRNWLDEYRKAWHGVSMEEAFEVCLCKLAELTEKRINIQIANAFFNKEPISGQR